MATMNKLNLKLIKRALVVARPWWISEEKRKAWGMLVLLVADTRFNVLFNAQAGEFTSALAARDGG
jgi:vitamin B12/bleomycin/antimicrobial peptide transport system ATP-binding/permease protein